MLNVQAIRQDIPSLGRSVYMNTGGVGPITRPVYDLLVREFTERFLNGSPLNMRPQSLQMEKVLARQTMARFLGAGAGEICFTRGVADGANIVMGGLPWRPGDEIITSNEENPSFLLPALIQNQRHGAVVRYLEIDNDPEVLLSRLETLLNERTRLVAVSHVTTDQGVRLPTRAVCDMAHEAGALVYFDGAQSVGRFPVDVKTIGCDFFGLLSYKWLLGPYTAGVLYIDQAVRHHLAVTLSGERAEKRIDYDAGTFEVLDTAQGFEYGPHGWPLYFGMAEAARYLERLGLESIEAQATSQACYLVEALRSIPRVRILSPEPTCPAATSTVSFAIEGMAGRDIALALRNRWNIILRATHLRHDGVRVSVTFFTSPEELDAVVGAIRCLAAGE